MTTNCVFCKIAAGELAADLIDHDEQTLTFLDRSPVFPGHLLVIPREHVETMADLPDRLLPAVFAQVRRATDALVKGLGAGGSFVAINNKVSQTVPHLHVHVIPRTKGDGMKGFFWPRRNYQSDDHRSEIIERLRQAFRQAAR